MEKDIQREMGGLSDQEPAPALLRIKNNQHSYLLRDFLDAMNAFQSAQIEYRDQSIGKIKRQAAISKESHFLKVSMVFIKIPLTYILCYFTCSRCEFDRRTSGSYDRRRKLFSVHAKCKRFASIFRNHEHLLL